MTVLNQSTDLATDIPPAIPQTGGQGDQHSAINVGSGERTTSVVAGSILALLGLSRGSLPGLLVAGVGGAMVYRGVTGHCGLYAALGRNTAEHDAYETQAEESVMRRGIHIEQSFLVNRPAADIYNYWRDFTNLPQIMTYLQSVEVREGGKSHWVAKAPRIAGGTASWDAEITRDEPNRVIAWRSLPGSEIDQVGEVRFNEALGDRGTEVHVTLRYVPPAGQIGHVVAKLLGLSPERQIHEDLRNFKRFMEVGELPSTEGQPHGTCSGMGIRSM